MRLGDSFAQRATALLATVSKRSRRKKSLFPRRILRPPSTRRCGRCGPIIQRRLLVGSDNFNSREKTRLRGSRVSVRRRRLDVASNVGIVDTEWESCDIPTMRKFYSRFEAIVTRRGLQEWHNFLFFQYRYPSNGIVTTSEGNPFQWRKTGYELKSSLKNFKVLD